MTVDLEDYFHSSNFDRIVSRSAWDDMPARLGESGPHLLDLLDACQVTASFFVLGWVAKKYPDLVREVHRRGHEIASHGFWHRLIYTQTPGAFRADIRDAKSLLEDTVGAAVIGYRAPSFSITSASRWALDILLEEGYRFDSSVFPVRHHRYGVVGSQANAYEIRPGLHEIPPSTVGVLGRERLAVAGGAYLRLLPTAFLLRAYRNIAASGNPLVLYIHPWELDVQQPRVALGMLTSVRHYWGTARSEQKLREIFSRFEFRAVGDVFRP